MLIYKIKKKLGLLMFLFLVPTISFAAGPVISHSEYSGNDLIISGQFLGSHLDGSPSIPDFLVIAWNDFESGVMDTGGLHLDPEVYAGNWRIQEDNNRSGSKYYAEKAYLVNNRGGALGFSQADNFDIWYQSFWFKLRNNTQSGKFTRLWGGGSQDVYLSTGGENTMIRGYFENGAGGGTQWSSPDSFGFEEWHRVEILMNRTSSSYSVWIDGKLQFSRNDWFPSGFVSAGHIWEIGGMIDEGTGGYDFDDVYFSSTQARVEIGNNSSWEDCNFKEIQVPKFWSDGSITVQANNGTFNPGDTAYLYVIDADGNVSNNGQGFQITIGEGSNNAPVDQPPAVSFTAPTAASSYSLETTSDSEVVILEGAASDDKTIQSVTYSTDKGDSGTATSTDGFSTWSVPVTVNKNETVVTTVTVTDDAGQQTSKTMTITCTCPVGWDATVQTGDTAWADSGVTYCVRLLVEGDSITDSAGQVVLGFQGRSSGSYTIRNVSIAQRDSAGSEGDVVDSTWKQVTFGGAAWNTSVTVPAGSEKISDPTTLSLQPDADYYVTFKIDAPSVYLDPPAGYRELYFDSADHTSDVDWSGNGFSVTQDFHALSKIYIYSPVGTISTPESFRFDGKPKVPE